MASFCVEKFGISRLKELRSSDIENRIQLFRELTKFEIEIE
jgi:hypothetical protein